MDQNEISGKLDGLRDKMDTLIIIFSEKLARPMTCTLKEIKASNRSRWIVLLSMLLCVIAVSGIIYYALNQLGNLTTANMLMMNQIEMLYKDQHTSNTQLQELIDLARENASTPDIEEKLQTIQAIYKPMDARTDFMAGED